MAAAFDPIILNGATSQADRWLAALADDYAQVDDRPFTQLLTFAAKLGRFIRFYDLEDEPDGDFVEFFLPDPTILLAWIETRDYAATESRFAALERETLDTRLFERKFELLTAVFNRILRLARAMNLWLTAIGVSPPGSILPMLRQDIDLAIQRGLAAQLQLLVAYAEGAGLPEALGRSVPLDTTGMLSIWGLGDHVCPDGSIYRGRSRNARIDDALPALAAIFDAFVDAMRQIQYFAARSLPATLSESDHAPNAALYIAFVTLFGHAQGVINTLSRRYIDFYYNTILQEHLRPAAPDQVYLAFTLAPQPGVTGAGVPRGTLFPAGTDQTGAAITYAADTGLLVGTTSIAAVQMVRVLTGSLLAGPTPGLPVPPDGVPRQILSTIVDPAWAKAAPPPTWSPFGAATIGIDGVATTAAATVGLAVASPCLLLTGGLRRITLHLDCTAADPDGFARLLGWLSQATGLYAGTLLADCLQQGLSLSASTTAGWFAILNPSVLWRGDLCFELSFDLPATAPPLVANGVGPAPALPTIKAMLLQTPIALGPPGASVELFPLALLAGLDVARCRISTETTGLDDLLLSTTTGPVDPTKPFAPFGSPATVGGFLDIRPAADEIFVKTPSSLQVRVKWFNLPPNLDGFAGYYSAYTIGLDGQPSPVPLFDNMSFRGAISVVTPGLWSLAPEFASPPEAGRPLFRTLGDPTAPSGPIDPVSEFDDLAILTETPPDYYRPGDSALRMQLTEPPYAFGDALYPQNVLAATIRNLPNPVLCAELCRAHCTPQLSLNDQKRWITAASADSAAAKDEAYAETMAKSLETCRQHLIDAAAVAAAEAIAKAAPTVPAADTASIRTDLDAAATAQRTRIAPLRALFRPKPEGMVATDSQARATALAAWIGRYRSRLEPAGAADLANAQALVDIVATLARGEAAGSGQPTSGVRRTIDASLAAADTALGTPYSDCMTKCLTACSQPKTIDYPNPPWQPQMESLALDYTAESLVMSDDGAAVEGGLFHLLPFGGTAPAVPASLLPRFADQGNLYIGLADAEAAATLTLLFRTAAAGPEGWSEDPPPLTWALLEQNAWAPLAPSQIPAESTNGLQNSGIVMLDLPAGTGAGNSLLPPDRRWLRIAAAYDLDMFPQTGGIYPNALLATWVAGSGDAHLAVPLPAGTINSAAPPLPAIAEILQPMPSFGGSPTLVGRSFEAWLGERLRHKNRGIQAWDYERLVLAGFPSVWQVQALPARTAEAGDVPGAVLVVVLPGPTLPGVLDPTAPVAGADLLGQIGSHLEGSISPFIDLQVTNPVYVRITVIAEVFFSENDDPTLDARQLNEDLIRFLSPWPEDAARAALGAAYVSEFAIAEFIRTRPYVEGIASIRYQYDRDRSNLEWYYLTTAKQHQIGIARSPGLSGGRA